MPSEWGVEKVEVLGSKRKEIELDPQFLSWKGGAILASLEGVRDTCIFAHEWTIAPDRCIRERAPFAW